jgi:hypothetical protein
MSNFTRPTKAFGRGDHHAYQGKCSNPTCDNTVFKNPDQKKYCSQRCVAVAVRKLRNNSNNREMIRAKYIKEAKRPDNSRFIMIRIPKAKE